MAVTGDEFRSQWPRRFGAANPERLDVPFWLEMVASGRDAYWARKTYGFDPDGPVWCFQRYGMSETTLSDGRIVYIGGEHEDYYDPDFCIYNDVIVRAPGGGVEVYGYPREAFRPTDFHTATRVGEQIFLIGCLGYPSDRRPGHTPVYSLDLSSYRISEIATCGEMPGWISRHQADCNLDRTITVREGKVIARIAGKERYRCNVEEYTLDLRSWRWRQITARNWPQFSIRREDRAPFAYDPEWGPEAVLPRGIGQNVACEGWNQGILIVDGVPVALSVETWEVRVIVKGELPDELSRDLAEQVRANAQAKTRCRCILERF